MVGQTSIIKRPTTLKSFLAPIKFKKQVIALIEEKPRAIMILGSTGLGKTTLADIIANKLTDKEGLDILRLNFVDNNGIDSVRALIAKSKFLPRNKHKVVILEEAHAATKQAQDAFLTELDFPPHNKITYIFTTNQAHKIQKTLHDRCAKLKLLIPPREQLLEYLIDLGFKKAIAEKAIDASGNSIRAAIQNADDLSINGSIEGYEEYSDKTYTDKAKAFIMLLNDPSLPNMHSFLKMFESPFMAIKTFADMLDLTIQVKARINTNGFLVNMFGKTNTNIDKLLVYADKSVQIYDAVRSNGELYYSRFISIFNVK